MDINQFVSHIADQYYDTPRESFEADTDFRGFDEWSSMTGLCILSMIKDEYGFFLDPQVMKQCRTIRELYNAVVEQSEKQE